MSDNKKTPELKEDTNSRMSIMDKENQLPDEQIIHNSRSTMWKASLSVAVCISIVVILIFSIKTSPVISSMLKEVPALSSFVQLIENDSTIANAIDHNLVQPVGATVESEGVQLTIEGIIADSRRMFIFYTVQDSNPNRDPNLYLSDFQLKNEQGENISGIYSWSNSGEQLYKGKRFDIVDIQLRENEQLPQKVTFQAKRSDVLLEVDFSIDHNLFAGMKEIIPVSQELTIDGQQIRIRNVIMTPLLIEVEVEYPEDNSKQINDFINLAIVDGQGNHWKSEGAQFSSDTERHIYFESGFFNYPEQLTLIADGIHANLKEQQIIANLQAEQLLQSPDERLSLEEVIETIDGYRLTFLLSGLDEVESSWSYSLLKDSFKDAEDTEFLLPDQVGARSSFRQESGGGESRFFYHMPAADYKQPVTFQVNHYPGYVLHPIEIKLK